MNNKLFKYETHLHTSEVSACGVSSAKEHVIAHYQKGYSGLVVTDHFFNGNCAINNQLSWEPRVKAFCSGYDKAKEAAKNLDFDVFFGFEYTYKGTDFLTYGIDKAFLLAHPKMLDWTPEEYFDRVHEAGGFIIHAHPFREESYIPKIRFFTDYIDAVEVYNQGNSQERYNEQAYEYAVKNKFPMTKGSDLHSIDRMNNGGMVFERKVADIYDLIKMIKNTTYGPTNCKNT